MNRKTAAIAALVGSATVGCLYAFVEGGPAEDAQFINSGDPIEIAYLDFVATYGKMYAGADEH